MTNSPTPAAMNPADREAEVDRQIARNAVLGFSRFDAADYLNSEEEIAAYPKVVAEDNDPELTAWVEATVAQARARWAAEAGQ